MSAGLSAGAGEPDGGRLERLAEFGERLDLVEIDRRDDPAPALAADEVLALEPRQRRPDRRARAFALALEPALRQPLAGAEIERQDHGAQLAVDVEGLGHGGITDGKMGWESLDIPDWYPKQLDFGIPRCADASARTCQSVPPPHVPDPRVKPRNRDVEGVITRRWSPAIGVT